MSPNIRRSAAGLTAGILLASIGTIAAAVGGYSGNDSLFSGNDSLFSGNIGPLSGNIGAGSGNVEIMSGNIPNLGPSGNQFAAYANTSRGAFAYAYGYNDGVRYFMWLEARTNSHGQASSRVWGSSYRVGAAEDLAYAYVYRCDPRCVVYRYSGSTHDFFMDPTLKTARFKGTLTDTRNDRSCMIDVTWAGGALASGHFLYGWQDDYFIVESAGAGAYRYATTDVAGNCLPQTGGWGVTYMDLWGAGVASKPLAVPA